MRIGSWNAKEIIGTTLQKCEDNANSALDVLVYQARRKLMEDILWKPPNQVVRKGGFGSADVSFVPRTGRNKGLTVSFHTDKRWYGRRSEQFDQLFNSIRRVNRPGSGRVRVYAGNFKAYWASMVEKTGYRDRGGKFHPPMHFLQAPFNEMKANIISKIQNG